ncbi:MAG: 16S rRNA (guanine(966)-N(2))-methyltransferase RsmD [Candidatus Omnitrophica bacterium]|nr:16S rRNA (guanine(966)-N(2))-methyltransferase RsmD [Candidatus Omnitrophota bacterium]
MIVTQGRLRGRKLYVKRGSGIRPTAQVVRKAIFDILGGWTEGKRVLDIYSGTGALGIEAASCGAREVVFVESNPEMLRILRRNIVSLNLENRCFYLAGRVPRILSELPAGGFDLILLDPPYCLKREEVEKVFLLFREAGALKKTSIIVLEHAGREAMKGFAGYTVWKEKRYGQTTVTFFKPAKQAGEMDEEERANRSLSGNI